VAKKNRKGKRLCDKIQEKKGPGFPNNLVTKGGNIGRNKMGGHQRGPGTSNFTMKFFGD